MLTSKEKYVKIKISVYLFPEKSLIKYLEIVIDEGLTTENYFFAINKNA